MVLALVIYGTIENNTKDNNKSFLCSLLVKDDINLFK